MSLDPYRTPAVPEREPPREQKARELVLPLLGAAVAVVVVHYLLSAASPSPVYAAPTRGEPRTYVVDQSVGGAASTRAFTPPYVRLTPAHHVSGSGGRGHR